MLQSFGTMSYGPIKVFRAYLPHIPAKASIRSELQASGVSIVDVPRNGRKDVADKMMIVDVLAYAMDNLAANSTIVMISGDRDFAYAIAVLCLRKYQVVVITLPNAHPSLVAQASATFSWLDHVLGHPKPPHLVARRRPWTLHEKGTKTPATAKISHPKSKEHEGLSLGAQTQEAESENPSGTRVEEAVLTPTPTSTNASLTKIRPPGALLSEILRKQSQSNHPPLPAATQSRTIPKKPIDPSVAPPNRSAGRPKISHRPIPQFAAGLQRFRFPILLQSLFSLYRIPVYQRRDVLPDIVSKFSKRPSKIYANFQLSKIRKNRLS
ncbi:hypothetical protein EST38_g10322 [Candolleomyces aberdarensis]|uniref:NYN domain-containing protein n=1 Tax=Candolleomyces aberdarensis TaxID=2316362 RepID=A0A4Q2D9B9_9AGAR|nr:hypothetical protein EST38_g10322 [Candolleomyces aberdarensis]